MAIFYNYIKGCGQDANNNGIFNAANIWTFLKWSDKMTFTEVKTLQDMRFAGNNPYLYFNSNSSYEVGFNKDLWTTGQIITSRARNQEMWYDLIFKNGPEATKTTNPDQNTAIQQTKSFFEVSSQAIRLVDSNRDEKANYPLTFSNFSLYSGFNYPVKIYDSLFAGYNNKSGSWDADSKKPVLSIPTYNQRFEEHVVINNSVVVEDCQNSGAYYTGKNPFLIDIRGTARIGCKSGGSGTPTAVFPASSDTTDEIIFNKHLSVDGYCKAKFFNATSDKRAKENINEANFSGLDIINNTNVYSFTYKNSSTPSIGIIAQDLMQTKINDFSFVENQDATGYDDDFMSIKESKLVYILWKAIQEQQKEINKLKKIINRGDNNE